MEQSIITQRITEIILSHAKGSKLSMRKYADEVGIGHTTIGKVENGGGMNIETLEKIVNRFPELKLAIAAVFNENITGDDKEAKLASKQRVIDTLLRNKKELDLMIEELNDYIRGIEGTPPQLPKEVSPRKN